MGTQKTVAFFPEAAYGPALNSVGIAQAVEAAGHKAVFLSDPGFVDVYRSYGFEARPINLSEPMPPEEMAKVPQVPGSLGEAIDALKDDCDFLLKGDVFTEDFLEMWIANKRK